MSFINSELVRIGLLAIPNDRSIDTLEIAREKFPGSKNSLNALCSRFDINNTKRIKHSALLDSKILSKIYLKLMDGHQRELLLYNKKNKKTVNGLNKIKNIKYMRSKFLRPSLTNEEATMHIKFLSNFTNNPLWKMLN